MNRDTSEVIFKPRPLSRFKRKRVLYIPLDTPLNSIHTVLKQRSIREKRELFGHLFLLPNTVVLSMCIGAPLAVIGLERCIASGAEEILILGFCGALDARTKIGDAVIITRASSEEGTSQHYYPRKRVFRPSACLTKELELTLERTKLPHVSGATVSTDAPFRETQSWLARNRAKGVRYVDMEASAVFALADFHNIEAAALMLVSDNLSDDTHEVQITHKALLTNIEKYFFPFLE